MTLIPSIIWDSYFAAIRFLNWWSFIFFPFYLLLCWNESLHNTYRINNPELDWLSDGVDCSPDKAGMKNGDTLGWNSTPSPTLLGFTAFETERIKGLTWTCKLQQPNRHSKESQCWKWAGTIQQDSRGLWELWCHGKFRIHIFYREGR